MRQVYAKDSINFCFLLIKATLLIFICLCNQNLSYAQAQFKVVGREPASEVNAKYRRRCFLSEVRVKKAYRECTRYFDEAVEEIPPEEFLDWREAINDYYKKGRSGESKNQTVYRKASAKYWFKNCRDFYPDRPPGFRRGEPESCLAYGEVLERNGKKEVAVMAYKKACGLDFNVPSY